MCQDDTFFQLSLLAQAGVLVLAVAMAVAVSWAAWRLGRRANWPTRLLVALGAFLIFEWLSPQVFYLWYRVHIPDLPLQWVIGPWPRPGAAVEVLLFQTPGSLSAHGRAGLGWALILALLALGRFRAPPRHL
ncbi:MAG: hypothetical protein AAGK00_07830 [Pseudomonadota bacterium]